MKQQYDEDEIRTVAAQVTSMRQLLLSLNNQVNSQAYDAVQRIMRENGTNTDHWKGQGWSKGMKKKKNEDYLHPVTIKRHLLNDYGHRCQNCEQDKWQGQPIPLRAIRYDTKWELNCYNCIQLRKGEKK